MIPSLIQQQWCLEFSHQLSHQLLRVCLQREARSQHDHIDAGSQFEQGRFIVQGDAPGASFALRQKTSLALTAREGTMEAGAARRE